MKFYILLLSTILFKNSFAQVTYNPNVVNQYNSVLKNLKPEAKEIFTMLQDDKVYQGGIVITTLSAIDTLNKEDLKPLDNSIKITNIDGSDIKTEQEWTVENMPIKLILGEIKNDTLSLKVTTWFMSEETIQHQIFRNKVISTYNEDYKNDSILLAKESTNRTSNLTVPVNTIKMVLSKSTFSYGDTIYGYAEIETDDFFFLREYNFKDDKIHKRYRLNYYFKITLKKPQE